MDHSDELHRIAEKAKQRKPGLSRQIVPLLAAMALCRGISFALANGGHELEQSAKLKPDDARAIALSVYPGMATDKGLEKHRGGSGLRYRFDIAQGEQTHEVGVDAKTGEVLENRLKSSRWF